MTVAAASVPARVKAGAEVPALYLSSIFYFQHESGFINEPSQQIPVKNIYPNGKNK